MHSSTEFPPPWFKLWDFQEPKITQQRLLDHLTETTADSTFAYQLEVQTQVARTLGLQMEYAAAHQLLDHIQSELTSGNPRTEIYYLLERGRVFNSSGEKQSAVAIFEQAWSLAVESNEDPLAMDAAHMVAIAAEPHIALSWSEQAMTLAEQSDNPLVTKWLGPLYNNTGWTHVEQQNYVQAMELFQKGLQFRIAQGWTSETVIALWTVAHTQRLQKLFEEALTTLDDVARAWRKLGKEPDGYVWEEQAECLLALGKTEQARLHFQSAWELLRKDDWLVANEPARIARLKSQSG
ncbi:MAG: hypothetical protein H8D86_00515 [Planctomycetes bacterium]|nr:hypothetical protein [Planctomycetota bacterium]